MQKYFSVIFVAWLLSVGIANAGQLNHDVHIWFKSFIPAQHPTLAELTRRTSKGTYVIPAPTTWPIYPSLSGTCFSTDDRNFEALPTASSRTTVEFVIKIRGREISVEPPPGGRDMVRVGLTRNVDCATGEDKLTPKRASVSGISIGSVRKDGFSRVFFVQASASDPFYTAIPAPSVDFVFTVRYDFLGRSIDIRGTADNFPSFEGYYELDGRAPLPIARLDPADKAGALSLFDLYIGLNSRNFETKIDLNYIIGDA